MILCEWDASEGHPGQSCVHLYARILSTSFISVSIFSVWCYSSVLYLNGGHTQTEVEPLRKVERQVKVLIKNLAIFFLFTSNWFLSISLKN
jgi:hypothetical protein